MAGKCGKCGKAVKGNFALCYDCEQIRRRAAEYRAYMEQTPEEREIELEIYYSTECDMCGKEGASPRKDGKNYCGTCWTIWNS